MRAIIVAILLWIGMGIAAWYFISCGSYSFGSKESIDLAPYSMQSSTFDCDRFFDKVSDKNFSVAILWGSFGTSNDCLRRVLNDSNLESFEIHPINAWCIVRGRCDSSTEIFTGSTARFQDLLLRGEGWMMQKIRERLLQVRSVVGESQKTCYISTGLETGVSPEASDVIVRLIREILPQCKTVYNPIVPTIERGEADFIEIHGADKEMIAPCIANLDGIDADSVDLELYHEFNSHCVRQFIWRQSDNCGNPNVGTFIPPHLRNCA